VIALPVAFGLARAGGIYRFLLGPGRPAKPITEEERKKVEEQLVKEGGKISAKRLKRLFPACSRKALTGIKQAWKKARRERARTYKQTLTWKLPGRVWALDGTVTKRGIIISGRRILVVRDLSSGYTYPVEINPERAKSVIKFLRRLFVDHGVPLVLKHDGGKGFTAKKTQQFLADYGVISLLSPPYHPQFNGATEPSMGDLKRYIAGAAEIAGQPRIWLLDDLENAVTMLNQREIRRAGKWTTPAQLMGQSKPVSKEERRHFLALHEEEQSKASLEAEVKLASLELAKAQCRKIKAKTKRQGTSQALVKSGNLSIEEGRISQVVSTEMCPTICGG